MKLAVLNNNGVIPDLSSEFEMLGEDDMMSADAILMWNDVVPIHHLMCREARYRNIPTFIMQHGAHATSDYKRFKPSGDYFFAWGTKDVEQCIDGGWGKDKVIRVGSTILQRNRINKPDGKTVVFAPLYPVDTDNRIEIWQYLNDMPDIKPVMKILEKYGNYIDTVESWGGNVVSSDRNANNHLDVIYDLLENASCVICQHEGTFDLIAFSMGIPVIKIKNGLEQMLPAVSVQVELKDLDNTIKDVIESPNIYVEERNKVITNWLGYPDDNPKQKIVEIINNVSNN